MYTILCVDDTPANLFTLESLFEPYDDTYKVYTASSGEEALGVLLTTDIDLILLDVMMPELDGFETAQLIKTNKKTKNIPIVFVTAKRDNQTIKNAFKFGVDYLSKPYDEFELFTRIKVHLQLIEAQRNLEEQRKFTQSVLDSQSNIVFIQDENKILKANKSFLDFFQVDNIEEFEKEHTDILNLFMEYESYLSRNDLKNESNWLNSLADGDKEYNILLMDSSTFEPKSFKIEVNNVDASDKYVVTLTDITKITTKSKHFENKATYDALTSVYNRSKFNDVFSENVKIAKEENRSLSFAIFDIDFFKKVNDTYGHIVGDETLIRFASTIQNILRETDTFARWGGEEFVLCMRETEIDEAVKVADNLREIISKTPFNVVGNVTCSIGVTQLNGDEPIDALLKRADDALYEAKENGRNRVYSL